VAEKADVIVVGGGLAGLVAAAELGDAGKRVILLDQEGENSLGGQAFWSLGGLFFVDSPEQRRLKIRDSRDLALQDWMGSAQFDRPEDHLAAQGRRGLYRLRRRRDAPWLHAQGMRWFPVVGWAERGGARPMATATRCRASTSPGAPVPARSSPSSAASANMQRRAASP
jgi:predicted oxidoreductase